MLIKNLSLLLYFNSKFQIHLNISLYLYTIYLQHTFTIKAIFNTSKFTEHRPCLKFCIRNTITETETWKILQKAFCNESLSKRMILDWYRLFTENREPVEDYCRFGCPSTTNIKESVKWFKWCLDFVTCSIQVHSKIVEFLVEISLNWRDKSVVWICKQ